MKQLLTSPKFITISLAVLALVVIPLTLIEAQNHQTIQQQAATTPTANLFGVTDNASCPGYNGDTNAVIWCGADNNGTAKASKITTRYNNGDGHNSAKSIQNIYGSKYFKITKADIQNLSKNAKIGTVTKGGDVILNGKVIAKNALTAGRLNITGSTKRSNNGTVFYTRPTQISFLDKSLKAYIVRVNGKFKFAILISCGNPIVATPVSPPKKPSPSPSPCPTLKPVNNVHIICPNCTLSPSPSPSPSSNPSPSSSPSLSPSPS